MQRLKQTGWVANFVIIAVVLAIVLFGSLYYLRMHRQELASTDTNGQTSPQQSSQTNKPSATSNNQSPATSKSATPSGSSSSNHATSPKTSAPVTSNTTTNGASSTAVSGANGSDTGNLPHTGPADTILSVGVLAVVTFFAVSYVQSRRA